MRKSAIITIPLLILIFAGSLLLLRFYKLDLIHTVVVNTVVLKAPRGYPEGKIRRTFDAARARAKREDREQDHSEKLLSLSQRLEKIQQLSHDELQELLEALQGPCL